MSLLIGGKPIVVELSMHARTHARTIHPRCAALYNPSGCGKGTQSPRLKYEVRLSTCGDAVCHHLAGTKRLPSAVQSSLLWFGLQRAAAS